MQHPSYGNNNSSPAYPLGFIVKPPPGTIYLLGLATSPRPDTTCRSVVTPRVSLGAGMSMNVDTTLLTTHRDGLVAFPPVFRLVRPYGRSGAN